MRTFFELPHNVSNFHPVNSCFGYRETTWQASGFPVGRKHIAMADVSQAISSLIFNREVPFLCSESSAIYFNTTNT